MRLHDATYAWLRRAWSKNWAAVSKPELQVVQQSPPAAGAAHLERAGLPRFDGKPENYADFKRRFQELVKTFQCSPVLEMTYLVDHLMPEFARYMRGVTVPATAWPQLDERYGDRRLAIMNTRHPLVSLKLPKGPAFNQVEALEVVQAEEELFMDSAMIGSLLGKLPRAVQTNWYDHPVTLPDASAVEEGLMFEQWLHRQGDAATMQALTILATEHSCGPTAPAPSHSHGEADVWEMSTTGPPRQLVSVDIPLRDLPAGGRLAENFSANSAGGRKSSGVASGNSGGRLKPRFATKEEAEVAAAQAASRMDPCSVCQGTHNFTRKLNVGAFSLPWPSHRLESCPEFTKLAPSQRATMIEAQGCCCTCTAFTHKQERCFQKNLRGGGILCAVMVAHKACRKRHHELLHGSDSSYCQAINASSQPQPSSQVTAMPGSGSLFELLEVPVALPGPGFSTSTLMMVDSGSTQNFHQLPPARSSAPACWCPPHPLHLRLGPGV